MKRTVLLGMATGLFLIILAGCESMGTKPPEVSHDGLHLVPDTDFAQVYRKPGADINAYSAVKVEPCQVSFKKNWLRDQNMDRMDLSNRVTQKDVAKIQSSLSEFCTAHFIEAMKSDTSFTLVDSATEGGSTLVLRPSIINLDVNAPDVQSPGMSRTYTTSSGEMTLFLELVDGATNSIVARVIDRQKDYDDGYMQWTNSVTNRSDADRILRRWTKMLKDGLDQAKAK